MSNRIHRALAAARCLALASATLLAACTIDNVTFNNGDGGGSANADAAAGPVTLAPSLTSATVTEGTTTTFTLGLSGPPLEPILVNLTPSDDTKLGVTPNAVLFSLDDWQTAQEVTLTGRADPDTVDEAITLNLASAMVAAGVDLAVTVDDDDGLALLVTPSNLDLGEGGTAPLMVRLSAQPPADVVVNVASSNTAVVTINPAQLTFTGANWAAPQTVTAFGAQDADTINSNATIDFSATDLTPVGLGVQVTDDDVLGISLSTTAVSISETGTQNFTVSLTQQPSANLTVALASAATGVATVTPASLTFTQANWNQPQPATVSGVHDDDTQPGATTIAASAAGLSTRTVSVNVSDVDVQSIQASPTSVALTEGGPTGTSNVRLAFRPAGNVIVSAASLATGVATVAPASLTFTPATYNVAQPITIIPTSDPDAADAATTVRLQDAASGLTRDVAVSVDDDEVLLLEVSSTAVPVTEGGTAMFGVRLTAQPVGTVTVNLASADPSAVTTTASLSFTAGNWNTFQPVTVTGVEDADVASETVSVSVTAAGLSPATVTVTTADNDTQALQLSTASLGVTEGSTATFTVRLAFQPSTNVTVTLGSNNTAAATVSPSSLTFNTGNWATPQTVTVTGTQDADIVPASATITAASAAAPSATVAVAVTDDDQQGILVNGGTAASLNLGEGTSGSFTVALQYQPAGITTVTLTNTGGPVSLSAASLTFTSATWNVPQAVTVTATADADFNFATATINVDTAGALTRQVAVLVTEPGIIELTSTSGVICPFDGDYIPVRLRGNPINPLTLTITNNRTSPPAEQAPSSLTFTSADFATVQNVFVNWNQSSSTTVTYTVSATVAGVTPVTYTLTVRAPNSPACTL